MPPSRIMLRRANLADVPTLDRWDREPHVIAATTDDPQAPQAFEGACWPEELAIPGHDYYIAELEGRAIGAVLIIDPHTEPTHYWGDVEPDLRAIDIWIGSTADLGRGYGTTMMRKALRLCFASPEVTAVIIDPLASNSRAHVFYRRLGFAPMGRQLLGGQGDDCLVHRLERARWIELYPDDAGA